MTRLDVSTDCSDCEARIMAEVIEEFYRVEFCSNCGQAIKWE